MSNLKNEIADAALELLEDVIQAEQGVEGSVSLDIGLTGHKNVFRLDIKIRELTSAEITAAEEKAKADALKTH